MNNQDWVRTLIVLLGGDRNQTKNIVMFRTKSFWLAETEGKTRYESVANLILANVCFVFKILSYMSPLLIFINAPAFRIAKKITQTRSRSYSERSSILTVALTFYFVVSELISRDPEDLLSGEQHCTDAHRESIGKEP